MQGALLQGGSGQELAPLKGKKKKKKRNIENKI
jgi:hypothetical protein